VGHVVQLRTSPRLPAGLWSAQAWDLVRAHPVYAPAESPSVAAARAAGADVTVPAGAAELRAATTGDGVAVWLGETLDLPGVRVEPVLASWDPPGAQLLEVVQVMDRLVSPGGDPWKREQTHQTLARYLLEEAYEAYDAIEAHDLAALQEELGDVLLQVVLHARMAEEAQPPWSIDDLAGQLVAKLVRRNPHVFAGTEVADIEEITANWERIKRAEKARDSAMDGIALSQPALALAAKVLGRAQRAGVLPDRPEAPTEPTDGPGLGAALFALVAVAQANGLDAEGALRQTALRYAAAVRTAEAR
jgi:XTP/dITP diphosphohydrolase